MLRSSSCCRISDEFFVNSPPSCQSHSLKQQGPEMVPLNPQLLPIFNPLSHAAEKERSRLRSAENAIHIIPLILVLSAFILWIFSSLESRV